MTFFRRLATWSASHYWISIPILFGIIQLAHSAFFGISDDEAYYWVLSQKPALGYAYHPPMIAWVIALSKFLLGSWGQALPILLVRFPAAALSSWVIWLSMDWIRKHNDSIDGAWLFLSFPGIWALSWMMVPDLPLFLGLILLWRVTTKLVLPTKEDTPYSGLDTVTLFLSAALLVLSKFSGVLLIGSSFLALAFWLRGPVRLRALLALTLGTIIGILPTILWNVTHEWVAILYQIRDRHGHAGVSWSRYGRFWAIEWLATGPLFLAFAFTLWKRLKDRLGQLVLLWVAPGALIFCIQPLFSDFKPHWAAVVWFPLFLELGARSKDFLLKARWRAQFSYAIGVWFLVTTILHFPLISVVSEFAGKPLSDPKLDVSNDLYGWSELPVSLWERLGEDSEQLPVLGARYQSAAQIGFALGSLKRTTLVPKGLRDRDEWPALTDALEEKLGEWPALKKPVLFVGDLRYNQGPEFPNANCVRLPDHAVKRSWLNGQQFTAKTILIWKCEPRQTPNPT